MVLKYTNKDRHFITEGLKSEAEKLEQEFERICYEHTAIKEAEIIIAQFVEHGGDISLIKPNR